jgi:predicted dehydrogenase
MTMRTSANTTPVKLGYVGCGFLAQHVHLPHFSSLPQAELVALAELRPSLARAVADRYRISRIVPSHHELCEDQSIEAVAVSADYVVQGDIAADLLRAGKHVFMEKPMAVSLRQADSILKAEHEGGARLMVAYMKRYDPANVLARETIREWRRSGDKGKLLFVRGHGFCGDWMAGRDRTAILSSDEPMPPKPRDQQSPDWLPADKRTNYIGYLQQYTHNINMARFLVDAPNTGLKVIRADLDADGMTGVVLMDFDGIRVAIESAQTKFHAWDEHTQVYFEGGWVHVHSPVLFANPGQPWIEIYEAGVAPTYRHPVPTPFASWHFREEAVHFLESLRSGEPFRSPGTDARADVALLEGVYRNYLGL